MIRRHSAKSTSSHGVNGTMAAALTTASSFPKRRTTSSTMPATSSPRAMSTSRPAPPAGAAVSAPGPLRSATTTVAPSAASLSAIALPIPCAAPVTMATRPSIFPMSDLVVVGRVPPAAPGVRVVRVVHLRPVLGGQLLDPADRALTGDRVDVERGLDLPLEGRAREGDVDREEHRGRPPVRVDQEGDVPGRVAGRLVEPEPPGQLDVAGEGLDLDPGVVPGRVRVSQPLERLVVPGLLQLPLVHHHAGVGDEPIPSAVVEVQVGVDQGGHLRRLEPAQAKL